MTVLFVLFGLFMAILIAAWVYSNAKDRNSAVPALWALLVFIFPLFFLPLYFIMRPTRPKFTDARKYLCPHCGKFFAEPANKCPYCGQNLHDLKEYKN